MIETAERTFASYLAAMATACKPELEIKLPPLPPATDTVVKGAKESPFKVLEGTQEAPLLSTGEKESVRERELSPLPTSSLHRPTLSQPAAAAPSASQHQASGRKPPPSPPPPSKPLRRLSVRIHFSSAPSYSAEASSCTPSLSFVGGYAISNPGPRRARSTFPCVDCPPDLPNPPPLSLCLYSTYDIILEVDPDHMAACSGSLVSHELVSLSRQRDTMMDVDEEDEYEGQGRREEEGSYRRFHYSMPIRVPSHSIKFAAGPYLPVPQVLIHISLTLLIIIACMASSDYIHPTTIALQYFPHEELVGGGGGGGVEGEEAGPSDLARGGGGEGLGVSPGGLVMTHLCPRSSSGAISHSTKPLYLVVNEYERSVSLLSSASSRCVHWHKHNIQYIPQPTTLAVWRHMSSWL